MSAPEEFTPPSVIYSSCYILSPCKWHLWAEQPQTALGNVPPGERSIPGRRRERGRCRFRSPMPGVTLPFLFKHQAHCSSPACSSRGSALRSRDSLSQASRETHSLGSPGLQHQAQAEEFGAEGCETEKGKCQGHWIRINRFLVVHIKVWFLDERVRK